MFSTSAIADEKTDRKLYVTPSVSGGKVVIRSNTGCKKTGNTIAGLIGCAIIINIEFRTGHITVRLGINSNSDIDLLTAHGSHIIKTVYSR